MPSSLANRESSEHGVAGREVGARLRRNGPACWPGYTRHWPDASGRCMRCKNVVTGREHHG